MLDMPQRLKEVIASAQGRENGKVSIIFSRNASARVLSKLRDLVLRETILVQDDEVLSALLDNRSSQDWWHAEARVIVLQVMERLDVFDFVTTYSRSIQDIEQV